MSSLSVLLSHLAAVEVDEHLSLLRRIAPQARFVVCYGGERSAFDQIGEPEKAFVADPSWRGPARSFQSYNEILATVHDRWLQPEPELDSCFLFEFDLLILRPDFDSMLRELATRTGAGLLAKDCGLASYTNWHHYTRFRRDHELLTHLRAVSVRDDPTPLFGMLASGMWMSRDAIASYVAVRAHPRCYGELYVPTLLHHLGHTVVNVDAVSRLYQHVRWEPDHGASDVRELQKSGATFVHPVKNAAVRRTALTAAAGTGPGTPP